MLTTVRTARVQTREETEAQERSSLHRISWHWGQELFPSEWPRPLAFLPLSWMPPGEGLGE